MAFKNHNFLGVEGRIKMFFHFALVGEERREEMLTKMPKNGRKRGGTAKNIEA